MNTRNKSTRHPSEGKGGLKNSRSASQKEGKQSMANEDKVDTFVACEDGTSFLTEEPVEVQATTTHHSSPPFTCIRVNGKITVVSDISTLPSLLVEAMGQDGTNKVEVLKLNSAESLMKAMESSNVEEKESTLLEDHTVARANGSPPLVTPTKPSNAETVSKGNDLPVLKRAAAPHNPYAASAKRAPGNGGREGTFETGSFAKKMRENRKTSGMEAMIHITKDVPALFPVKIGVLDFVNPVQNFTHWLHRAPKWIAVLNIFKESGEKGMEKINLFLSYLASVQLRDPAGEDKGHTMVTKGKNGQLSLTSDVFLFCYPMNTRTDELVSYVRESFGPIFKDEEIQGMYFEEYMSTSSNANAEKMLQVPGPDNGDQIGKYWSQLQGSLGENCSIITHESLDDFLTSEGIADALNTFAGTDLTEACVKAKTIPEGLKMFVYGRE
jgi:hypothetical protein